LRCKCGARVRPVTYRGELFHVDEEPVPGGPLIVNVDEVVLRRVTHSSSLGFCVHRCWTRYA
jgi:hypothetical protein